MQLETSDLETKRLPMRKDLGVTRSVLGVMIVALTLFTVVGYRTAHDAKGYIATVAGQPVRIDLPYAVFPGWRPMALGALRWPETVACGDGLAIVHLESFGVRRSLLRLQGEVALHILANEQGSYPLGPVSLECPIGRLKFAGNILLDVAESGSELIVPQEKNVTALVLSRMRAQTIEFQVQSRDRRIEVAVLPNGLPTAITATAGEPLVLEPQSSGSLTMDMQLSEDEKGPGTFLFRPWLLITTDEGTERAVGPLIKIFW